MRVLITTFPFAEEDKTPLQILKKEKIDFTINPFNRKILLPIFSYFLKNS